MIVTLNEGDRANIVCDPKRDPRKDVIWLQIKVFIFILTFF
jgi:hypothetical protein